MLGKNIKVTYSLYEPRWSEIFKLVFNSTP